MGEDFMYIYTGPGGIDPQTPQESELGTLREHYATLEQVLRECRDALKKIVDESENLNPGFMDPIERIARAAFAAVDAVLEESNE